MKKIIITSILTVSLFFCFFTKVKADTNIDLYYKYNSGSLDDLINVKTAVENYISSNNLQGQYFIYYRESTGLYYAIARKGNNNYNFDNAISSDTAGICFNQNPYAYYGAVRLTLDSNYNITSSSITSLDCTYISLFNLENYQNYNWQWLYFNFNANIPSSITFDTITYHLTGVEDTCITSDTNLYSVSDIYNCINSSPPTPPDDTPLLTSFVNVVLDKLTLTTDFFTSSYIYLSIFVIIIFYFSICLLRRFTK